LKLTLEIGQGHIDIAPVARHSVPEHRHFFRLPVDPRDCR
jgi:hypothetical protein